MKKKNAIKLFKLISKLSKKFKIIFCIEPNSKIYNCNYINKIHEAKKIIQKINSKYLRINFDTGNFSLENDKIRDVKKLNNYIANFQISEKNLNSLENRKINHEKILSNLKIGKKIISLETSNLKLSKLKKNIYILKKIIKNIKSQC